MPAERKRAERQKSDPQAGVPLPLRHTGEVDEFDAAVARGASGATRMSPAVASAGAGAGARSSGAAAPRRSPSARPPAAGARGAVSLIGKAIAFLQASWAELQRVQWPDRRQVVQATAVVLGFVVVAGVYLGAADWVAQKVVNFIL